MRQRKGPRLPSYDELLDAAEKVRDHDDGVEIAVAGGLAMQIWGSPRLTGDLDVVARINPGYTGTPLSFGGVRTHEGKVEVDIIVRNDEWRELYDEALSEAVDVDEVPLPVVLPEFLVAMKMVAGRPKDEIDIRYLVLLDDFELEYATKIIRKHLGSYALRELRSLIEEAKWRKSRGEE